MKLADSSHILKYIKEGIDFKEFLEVEISCNFDRTRQVDSGKCCCPMPSHKENTASFFVRKLDDGIWVYHCFGCGSKGTIINFFMEYYQLSFEEALREIQKKFSIENIENIVIDSIINSEKKFDMSRRLENLNIVASNQCRNLARLDKKHIEWVKSAYEKLNIALDEQDLFEIERIGNEAFERMISGE